MAKEGGFGFGTIIACIIFYNIFFGGSDDVDDKKIEIVENDKPVIIEKINDVVENITPKITDFALMVSERVDDIRDDFQNKVGLEKEEVKEKEEEVKEKEEKKKIKPQVVDNDNIFDREDIYGSTDDKW